MFWSPGTYGDVALVVFLRLFAVSARCLGFAPSAESAIMLDGESTPKASVVTQAVERMHGIPSGTKTGSARIVARKISDEGRRGPIARSPRRSGKRQGYSGKSSRCSEGSELVGA